MTAIPTIKTPSWTPKSFEEIQGKVDLYKTARVTETGEIVALTKFSLIRGIGSFKVADGRWFNWTELDSFCL